MKQCATGVIVVVRENFVEDFHDGTAVDQQVVKGPHQAAVVFREAEQSETHQRSGGRIEAGKTVSLQECGDFLFANVAFLPVEWAAFLNALNWCIAGAVEAEAQRFMALSGAFPGCAESGSVEVLAERADHLLNVAAGARVLEAVREHSLLKGR